MSEQEPPAMSEEATTGSRRGAEAPTKRRWLTVVGLLTLVALLPFAVATSVRWYRWKYGGIPFYIQVLTGEAAGDRAQAAYALGVENPPREVVLANGKGLHDEDRLVRQICTSNLRRAGPAAKWALADMIAAMARDDAAVRLELAGALGNVGGPEAIQALEAVLKDEAPSVRQAAAEALEKIKAAEEEK